jgi:hypothetical protein
MAIKIIKLYKPFRGAGSTTAIVGIIKRWEHLRIAVVSNSVLLRNLYAKKLEGHSYAKVFSYQGMREASRGCDFDLVFFTDCDASEESIFNTLAIDVRDAIVIKEVSEEIPNEIYD